MDLQEIDLSKLDFNEIGSWPSQMRAIAFVFIGLVAIGLGYFLFVSKKITEFDAQHNKQITLRNEFRDKYHKAANRDVYKNQMEEMKTTLRGLLRQLPSDGNVPSLMEDISLQATTAGLEFNLIKPGIEVPKEFYTELPIDMTIIGSYHGFGKFISGIAKLPRIVTLHNFDITVSAAKNNDNKHQEQILSMKIEAKTYWCANRENL